MNITINIEGSGKGAVRWENSDILALYVNDETQPHLLVTAEGATDEIVAHGQRITITGARRPAFIA